ncbi:ATP-binding protein [Streptomyces sp. NBC_01803]|uniref:ATP-binding protein n=1 Tax=Streptomyces sp. NBC_01803 TaxID=2975946 RepID=UPI002DD89800|nr:ATP-binding protein [Streptomyces sp. NBC_01803]WSA45898.1 ATP-binding protein [Streptomyces sp. NBC_01803]
MKQATQKTLGVAALGAALVAAAAGTASASVTDDVGQTTGDVVNTLPLHETADKLPGDSGEVVRTGTDVLTGETEALPVADRTLSHTTSDGLIQPATELLGGMPVDPTSELGIPTDNLLGSLHLGS